MARAVRNRAAPPDSTAPIEPALRISGLTKSFGSQTIWEDVTMEIPKGQVTVILGPSGTGKSVLLKHLVGLLQPDRGEIWMGEFNIPALSEKDLYAARRKYGVLFQDGALFGSMNVADNTAFPLREHTKKSEKEIREIVKEKLAMVGLTGAEGKLPNEISGGMRKRAGLARGLVLAPDIILFDEPDSGLDPVRTAFLGELVLQLKKETGSTMIVVTHNIRLARNIADYIGLIYLRHLVAFGPARDLFESDTPVVRQFLAGATKGPIGMSEEADQALPGAAKEAAGEAATFAVSPEAAEAEEGGEPAGRKRGGGAQYLMATATGGLQFLGKMAALTLDSFRVMFRRPVPIEEFIRVSWFIASVSIVPVILVSLAFGMTTALQVGNIARQLSAQSTIGAGLVLGVVREVAPIATALLIAGAAGSAMTADIGSRKIREEIDAMEVLGVHTIHRVIVPRIWAAMFVAVLLDGFVSVAGIGGGFLLTVSVQGGTAGSFLGGFSLLTQQWDLYYALTKAAAFGFIAAVVAAHMGLEARGGAKSVGDAVNRGVVLTFVLVFVANVIFTLVYFQLVPPKFG